MLLRDGTGPVKVWEPLLQRDAFKCHLNSDITHYKITKLHIISKQLAFNSNMDVKKGLGLSAKKRAPKLGGGVLDALDHQATQRGSGRMGGGGGRGSHFGVS